MVEPTRIHRDFAQYASPNSVGKYSDIIVAELGKKKKKKGKFSNR